MKIICILLLLHAAFLKSSGQQDPKGWILKKEQDSIRIFSRSGVHSQYNELKVELTVHARLSALAALILDISSYPQWSYNTKKSYILKTVSASEMYFYTQIDSPWPASDRDLVIHLLMSQNPVSHGLTIKEESVPGFIPAIKNFVRVPRSLEKWTVTPIGHDRISIEYYADIDPGEAVPAWLINFFGIKAPLETFQSLKRQIQKPTYQQASVSFIKN